MSKYTKGQQFQFNREGYQSFGIEELPHSETLTIEDVIETESAFSFMPDEPVFKVSRHFTADGLDKVTEVTLTTRDLDNIINRGY